MREDKKHVYPNPDNKHKADSYKNHLDPRFGYSPTDVYYNIERKLPESKVAIPTLDAVLEAKKWVDDINKK